MSRVRTSCPLFAIGLLSLSLFACSRGDDEPNDFSPGAGASGGSSGGVVGGGSTGNPAGGSTQNPSGGAPANGGTTSTSGAGGSGASGGSVTAPPGKPTLPNGRGATVPFVTYEAEDMATNGTPLGPSRNFGEAAAESSGRRAVRLSSTGQYVEFTNAEASNSIVVRYSIPDNGNDYWTTLSVLVDGQLREQLTVTSRYSWTYGNEGQFNQPAQNDPGAGSPHHFFDETRALVGDIPVGSTVTIKKEGGDGAAYYDIDLVEMELVADPLPMPDRFKSITECGATPNDDSDDSAAIQKCVDDAQALGFGVWIPEGVFRSTSKTISVGDATVRGAGMWYSMVSGFFARFDCWKGGCQYSDFAVFGDTTQRDDDSPETAFSGNGSSGVSIDRVWVEHQKVGCWPGPGTNGLTIKNSRFRNLHADAVNLYGGTHDSVVENNHIRNTGDDALAMWSHDWNGQAPSKNNVFRHNYVQIPWKANCFALYGGESNVVEDNVCADVVQYPGLLLARQFDSHLFSGMTKIDRNSLFRAGGFTYGKQHGAFKLHADEGQLQNITVTELEIVEPTFAGIHVQGGSFIDSVWLNGVTITNPGNGSFLLDPSANGAMDAVGVVASGAAAGVINNSNGNFNLIKGEGSTCW